METLQKKSVDEVISLVARLALFVVDELVPVTEAALEEDLEELYDFVIAVERKARATEFPSSAGPASP